METTPDRHEDNDAKLGTPAPDAGKTHPVALI